MAKTESCHGLQVEECSGRNLKMMFGVNVAFSLAYANSMVGQQCSVRELHTIKKLKLHLLRVLWSHEARHIRHLSPDKAS